jgi:hypothetical protein
MKPDDIIYIALICFVVAVVLWAYSDDISKSMIGLIKGTGLGLNGGNKKRRKRRKTV